MNLIKKISAYSLVSLLTGTISFLLLPLLTTYLTTEDYGILSLFNASIRFIAAIIPMGIGYVLMVYLYEKENEFSDYFKAFLKISFFNSIIITFLIIILLYFVSSFIGIKKWLAILIPLIALVLVYFEVFASYFIYKKNILNYSKLTLLKFFIEILFVLILVVAFPFNWEGRIMALVISIIIGTLYGFYYFNKNKVILRDKVVSVNYKALIKTGLPLISLNLAIMVMNLSDRFFIEHIVGLSATGLYSIASIIAGIELMIIGAATNVIRPIIYENMNDYKNNRNKIISISIKYIVGLFIFSIILGFLTQYIFKFMIDVKFSNAINLVYPLIIGMFFWGIYNHFVSFLMYKKKNNIIGVISIIGLIVNLILNYFFILKYQEIGAAYATLISYLLISIFVVVLNIIQNKNNVSKDFS